MIIPTYEEIKKSGIAAKSILAAANRSKVLKKNGIGPGRYSHGPHIEDVAYLVQIYFDAVAGKQIREGQTISLQDYQSLALQQMIGIPARTTNNLNTDEAGNKLTEAFNKLQNKWYFRFEPHKSQGTAAVMKYLVRDVGGIGGNELGLGGLFDL